MSGRLFVSRVLAREPLLGAFLTWPVGDARRSARRSGLRLPGARHRARDLQPRSRSSGDPRAPTPPESLASSAFRTATSSADAGRALDLGASGTLFPRADGAAPVRAAVECVKYAPAGKRGLGGVRANRYGAASRSTTGCSRPTTRRRSSSRSRPPGALNAACEIASEKWVDLLFVGPNDLSQALGVPGHYDDPRYVARPSSASAPSPASTARRRGSCCARPTRSRTCAKLGYTAVHDERPLAPRAVGEELDAGGRCSC